MRFISIAALMFVTGAAVGAWIDTPLLRLIDPNPPSFASIDRAEILEHFPPKGDIAFIGDSHVERGPWPEGIANYGIGGDSVSGALHRLDTVKQNEIILLIGVNNIIAGHSPDDIAKGIDAIIERADRPVTLLSVMPVGGRYSRHNEAILNLNERLPAICTDHCNLIDTWSLLSDGSGLDERFTRDGLHLNVDGYERLLSIF